MYTASKDTSISSIPYSVHIGKILSLIALLGVGTGFDTPNGFELHEPQAIGVRSHEGCQIVRSNLAIHLSDTPFAKR